MDKKIGFEDLSNSLKIFVVLGWVLFSLMILSFIVGFIEGIIRYGG